MMLLDEHGQNWQKLICESLEVITITITITIVTYI